MSKHQYRFNADLLSIEKVEMTLTKRFKKISFDFFWIGSIICLTVIFLSQNFSTSSQRIIDTKAKEAINKLHVINVELNSFEKFIQAKQTANRLYEIALGQNITDSSIFDAGIGGAEIASDIKNIPHAAFIKSTLYKLEILNSKLLVLGSQYSKLLIQTKNRDAYLASVPAIFPLDHNTYRRVSSPYGYRRHPITKQWTLHDGVDLAADMGVPVYATGGGVVMSTRYSGGYGYLVQIRHMADFTTRYGHLSKFNVKAGDVVKRGDVIGFVGNSGLSTGPHLHYEVRLRNAAKNPRYYYYNDIDIAEHNRLIKDHSVKPLSLSSLQ